MKYNKLLKVQAEMRRRESLHLAAPQLEVEDYSPDNSFPNVLPPASNMIEEVYVDEAIDKKNNQHKKNQAYEYGQPVLVQEPDLLWIVT